MELMVSVVVIAILGGIGCWAGCAGASSVAGKWRWLSLREWFGVDK